MGDKRQPKEVSDGKYEELVRAQYEELLRSQTLGIDPKIKPYLLPQTVHGRAMMGHGSFFDGRAKPNISMEEIVKYIGLNPQEVRGIRQQMMEEVRSCIDDLFEGKKTTFTNRAGSPLYGVEFLADYQVEVDREFFKGGAIVGRMDSPLWRERTKITHPFNLRNTRLKLGYGEELPIDVQKLREENLSFNNLCETSHSLESLTYLKAKGVIVPEEEISSRPFENHFVRYSAGCGVCDDAALISLGLLHGPSAMVFGFVIDATDTYTKFCQNKVPGGFDEFLGAHIEKKWKEKYNEELVSDKETIDIIYLGAKNTLEVSCFSSSHKRFMQYEEAARPDRKGGIKTIKQSKPTFLNHLSFVTHGEAQDFDLGFDRFHSLAFYENIRERFRKTGREYFLPKRSPCSA
jgi:hypothetical protein